MTFTMINEKLEECLGYSREEVDGKITRDRFVVTEDLERKMLVHRTRRNHPSKAQEEYEY